VLGVRGSPSEESERKMPAVLASERPVVGAATLDVAVDGEVPGRVGDGVARRAGDPNEEQQAAALTIQNWRRDRGKREELKRLKAEGSLWTTWLDELPEPCVEVRKECRMLFLHGMCLAVVVC
jgi:hypothetical protein